MEGLYIPWTIVALDGHMKTTPVKQQGFKTIGSSTKTNCDADALTSCRPEAGSLGRLGEAASKSSTKSLPKNFVASSKALWSEPCYHSHSHCLCSAHFLSTLQASVAKCSEWLLRIDMRIFWEVLKRATCSTCVKATSL